MGGKWQANTVKVAFQGLHRLGKTDVPVYDGSWTEWVIVEDTPEV